MSHVFISYSRRDLDFAKQLVDDLQKSGLKVWFDQISIEPGMQWDAAIEEGLKAAIAVIVIISPDSMESINVRNEINFARDNDQLILPVLFKPAQVQLNLESINWVDLSQPTLYQANLPRLIARMAREVQLLDEKKLPLGYKVSPPAASLFSGIGEAVGQDVVTVAQDSRQVSQTQLRRYIRTLAVIAAPFVNKDGEASAANALDINLAWRNLAQAVTTAYQLPGDTTGAPLALVRLAPPTASNLTKALNIDGADGYQIIHLVAQAQNGTLLLENEDGSADGVQATRFKAIFGESKVKLLVCDAPLADEFVDKLLAETPLQAIIAPITPELEDATLLFNSRFYGRLASGEAVNTTFTAVTDGLKASHPQLSYRLKLKNEAEALTLDLPPVGQRADKPLIDSGLPPMRNVPVNLGFVGRGQELQGLHSKAFESNIRQMAINGIGGIGKSWVASEYISRFGWRYPDGILWMRICEQTKSEDILGQMLALLEMSATTAPGDLRNELKNRQVLVILDQANEWNDPLEVGEITDFIARVDPLSGTRFMLTAWADVEPLSRTNGTSKIVLQEMPPNEASILIQRLIKDHNLQSEFDGVANGLAQFTEKTFFTPWLIRKGIDAVKLDGLEYALEDLAELPDELDAAMDWHIGRQVDSLKDDLVDTRDFLRKLQGVPDSFDRKLAEALATQTARQHLRELVRRNLLRREGKLYNLPAIVRAYLRQNLPLSDEEQDQVDEAIIKHMLADQVYAP